MFICQYLNDILFGREEFVFARFLDYRPDCYVVSARGRRIIGRFACEMATEIGSAVRNPPNLARLTGQASRHQESRVV